MSDRDFYEKNCKPEFKEIQKDVSLIKQKVFNGFGDSIKRIERLQYWQLGIVSAIVIGAIGYVLFG